MNPFFILTRKPEKERPHENHGQNILLDAQESFSPVGADPVNYWVFGRVLPAHREMVPLMDFLKGSAPRL